MVSATNALADQPRAHRVEIHNRTQQKDGFLSESRPFYSAKGVLFCFFVYNPFFANFQANRLYCRNTHARNGIGMRFSTQSLYHARRLQRVYR